MTFIVGAAFRPYAFLASDSRAGRCGPGGELNGFSDGEPKLVRRVGRWFASSPWGDTAPSLYGDEPQDDEALRARFAFFAPQFKARSERYGRGQAAAVEIRVDADGPSMRLADCVAGTLQRAPQYSVWASFPAVSDPSLDPVLDERVAAFRREIARYATPFDAYAIIAALYRDVYAITGENGTVSPDFEVGALTIDENGQTVQDYFPLAMAGAAC